MRVLGWFLLLSLLTSCTSVYHGTGYIPPPPSAYHTVRPTPWSSYTVGY